MGLDIGQIIDGKYRIVRLLGEGGMGAVYEGENVRIHRRVAIKVLHANVAGNVDSVQRFEREAQAAGRIGSDHIVEVLDLGNLPEGDRYMVMEYLDGESLSQRIQSRGRLDPREAGPLLLQLLEGLASAHGAGIIHRDLKPDNVFLLRSRKGQGDFVKILDFGISKFNSLNADSGMSKTRTGAVMGTPYYMSPEQAKGAKDMDHRSDLYSAGVILYEAITGQVPFDGDTFNELIFKIALETPVPPERHAPDLHPAFSAIVLKGMAREPKDRFQSAQEFAAAIEGWLASVQAWQGLPPPRPPAPSAPMYPATQTAPTPMLAQTPAPWSQTGATQATEPAKPMPRKKSYAAAVAIAAGVVVAGAGVVIGVRATKNSPAQVSVAAPVAALAGAPTDSTIASPSPVGAAAPIEPKVAAEPAPAAHAEPVPAPSTTSIEAPANSAKSVVAFPPAKHGAAKRAAAGAAGPAAPAGAAPPAAPADNAGVTARKIRTEL